MMGLTARLSLPFCRQQLQTLPWARILAIPAQSVRPPDTRSIGCSHGSRESENGGGQFNWAGISLREM